jgi:hypothetical protein
MRRLLCVCVTLLLTAALPRAVSAQSVPGQAQGADSSGGLHVGQNYPNPFNPTTRIPFELSSDMFQRGTAVVVTIRIYNVLHQLVAIPTALNHPAGSGVPVDNLQYYSAGWKEAYWDGYDRTGQKVASGIYYAQVSVRGYRPLVIKMLVAK